MTATSAAANPLTAFYPDIRARIAAAAASCAWPELDEQVARHLTRTKLPLSLLLPVASAAAVGGEPRRALSTSAACSFLLLAMRWFDDLQDRDRDESLWQEVGPGRATNLAAAALTVAWRILAEDAELPRPVLTAFGELTVALARGQDGDLRAASIGGLDDYWRMMAGKSGAALALACRVGALAGGGDRIPEAAACGRFGEHMGTLLQVLDDLDGAFHPDGLGDLAAGKVTLPVVYALAVEHAGREELAAIVAGGRLAAEAPRALEILEAIHTREFLVWAALEERRQGLFCLHELPPPATPAAEAGRDALEAFADALLVGWEGLLDRPPGDVAASARATLADRPRTRGSPRSRPWTLGGGEEPRQTHQPGYFGPANEEGA